MGGALHDTCSVFSITSERITVSCCVDFLPRTFVNQGLTAAAIDVHVYRADRRGGGDGAFEDSTTGSNDVCVNERKLASM